MTTYNIKHIHFALRVFMGYSSNTVQMPKPKEIQGYLSLRSLVK